MNKKLILLLVLVLIMGVLVGGCSKKLPDGFESTTFYKDLDKLTITMIDSFSTKTYKEEDINKTLDKINTDDYKAKLNNYELSILKSINDVLPDIKQDLNSNNHTLTSETYEKIKWILDIFEQ